MSSGSRALVGLLSEPSRLKVVAALALGATTAEDVVRATGLEPREVAAALRRLDSGGLVGVEKGQLRLHEGEFKEAARAETAPPPADTELSTDPPTAAVLRVFAPDGRILSLPSSRQKRRLLLGHVARIFEPGLRYAERDVNSLLRAWHDDHAMLRRYLYDEGFLDRADGVYWRIGGWVDTEPAPAAEPEPERFQRVAAYGVARDGELVLLSRLARSPHKGRWTLPGGGLDFGERPADAVVREVHEETGLHVRVEELLDADAEFYRATGDAGPFEAHAVRFLFRVTVLGGTLGVVEVDGSTDDARWWPVSGLPELTPMAERALRTGRFNG